MKFGLFSNGYRMRPVARDSYADDLHEVVTADRLGFDEAWISEHVTLRPDGLPVPEMFFCKAAAVTSHIKFGAAVRLLPLYHPIDVATQAVVCDHLTDGRYYFGFGSGAPAWWITEPRGIDLGLRHEMMTESLEFITKAWTAEEPFDFNGRFWQSKRVVVLPKPLQKPFPQMAVATRTEELLEQAGRDGYIWLGSHYFSPPSFRQLTDTYKAAAKAAGRENLVEHVRAGLAIYVADSVEEATRDIWEGASREMDDLAKMVNVPHFRDYVPPAPKRYEDINLEYLIDVGMFHVGDPDTVFNSIKDYYNECGGFGGLLIVVGKEWSTREKRDRSMELFMQHVAPRLRALEHSQAPASSPVAA
jgi:alkanesulfonate monooxygenase SsuD/methylene tetrahydromethanopterin reductase-like flavin-dependent oxidoreductase (luciferase family)